MKSCVRMRKRPNAVAHACRRGSTGLNQCLIFDECIHVSRVLIFLVLSWPSLSSPRFVVREESLTTCGVSSRVDRILALRGSYLVAVLRAQKPGNITEASNGGHMYTSQSRMDDGLTPPASPAVSHVSQTRQLTDFLMEDSLKGLRDYLVRILDFLSLLSRPAETCVRHRDRQLCTDLGSLRANRMKKYIADPCHRDKGRDRKSVV